MIRAGAQHGGVVVTFYHKVLGHAHVVIATGGDGSCISSDYKVGITEVDGEACIVAAVVACFESCDGKRAYREGKFFVDWLVIVAYAAAYAMPPQQAVESLRSSKKAHVAVVAEQGVGEAHMIAVVVSQEYTLYRRAINAVGGELFGHIVVIDAGVDKQTTRWRAYVCTIATAAAAEGQESQLFFFRNGFGRHLESIVFVLCRQVK